MCPVYMSANMSVSHYLLESDDINTLYSGFIDNAWNYIKMEPTEG